MSLTVFRSLLLLIIDGLFVGGIGASALQSPAIAVVAGRVIDAETGAPMRFVQVELSSRQLGKSGNLYQAVTGEDGVFSFDAVQEGAYFLGAARAAYPAVFYSPDGSSMPSPGAAVTVASGQRIDGIKLALRRGGVISGRIADEAGNPVSLSLRVLNAGLKSTPNPVYFSFGSQGPYWGSDPEGHFRIYGLAAGDYFLIAEPYGEVGSDQAGRRMAFARAYSPDTADPWAAAPLSIAAGQERSGVNLTMRRVPLLTVSGSVGPPPASRYVSVRFQPVSRRPLNADGYTAGASSPDNRFTWQGAPPGRYWVTATTRTPAPPDAPKGTRPTLWWALNQIVLTDQDLSGLNLVMQSGLTLSGKVELAPGESADGLFIAIAAAGDDVPPIDEREGAFPVAADGRFEISNATPGRYRIVVTARQTPVTVTSTALGGRQLENGEFELSVGSTLNDLVVRIRR